MILSAFLRRRRGGPVLEYALLVALLAGVALGAVVVFGERTARLPAQTDDVLSGAAPPPGAAPEEVLDLLQPDLAWLPRAVFLPLSPAVRTREVSLDLTNFGAGASGPIGAPTLSGAGLSAFSIVSSTCPARLRSGESCAVVVRASADDNGAFEAFLSAAGAPDGVELSALASGHASSLAFVAGGGPGLDVAVTQASGGGQVVSGVRTLTLANTGTRPMQILPEGIRTVGEASRIQAGTDGCAGVLLAPGATCSLEIALVFSDNETIVRRFDTQAIDGTAAPAIDVSGTASGYVSSLAFVAGAGPGLDVAGSGLTPPGTTLVSATRTLTLANTGTRTLQILGDGIRPAGASSQIQQGTDGCAGATLLPGATCALDVALVFSDNGTLTRGFDAQASDGTAAPAATVSGTASGYGGVGALALQGVPGYDTVTVDIGTGNDTGNFVTDFYGLQTFVLTNAGSGPVQIASIVGNGGGTIQSQGCPIGGSLAPGASCSFVQRFYAGRNFACPELVSGLEPPAQIPFPYDVTITATPALSPARVSGTSTFPYGPCPVGQTPD